MRKISIMKNRIKVSLIAFILGLSTYSFGIKNGTNNRLPATSQISQQNKIDEENLKNFISELLNYNNDEIIKNSNKSTLPGLKLVGIRNFNNGNDKLLGFYFYKNYDPNIDDSIISSINSYALVEKDKKKIQKLSIIFQYDNIGKQYINGKYFRDFNLFTS